MSGNFNTTQYENPNTLSKTEEETLNQKLNTKDKTYEINSSGCISYWTKNVNGGITQNNIAKNILCNNSCNGFCICLINSIYIITYIKY